MSIAHIKNTSETLPKSLHPWGASVCDKNKNRDAYDMIYHTKKEYIKASQHTNPL